MKINAVTTFSDAGYRTYGRLMLDTFAWGWPKDIPIYVYHEGGLHEAPRHREQWRDLSQDADRAAFMAKYKDEGKDFRQWPVKFCHKVFAVTSAPRDCDWLIWLDGDIETIQPVKYDFLKTILPWYAVASYLGRRHWCYTETGFVAYNLANRGGAFLDELRRYYTQGRIDQSSEKHDCMAFDYVRQVFEGKGCEFNDLGKDHRPPDLDVMAHSPLAKYLWHNKGALRKLKTYGAVA